jgi:hypothetical protein
LCVKVGNAVRAYDRGQARRGNNVLGAFINEVSGMMRGRNAVMPADDGDHLIAEATNIIDLVNENGLDGFEGQDLNTAEVPSMLNLSEAFPNPFNSTTTIAFSLTEQQQVSLQVFDLSGRLVETLVDGLVEAGSFSAVWNADMQSTGVYYYHIQVGSFQQTKMLMLVK